MTYFLDRIAAQLYEEFGDRLDRHCLVFPNRRAGLYFLKYLSSKPGKPIWSPEIRTINELFQTFSSLKLAENELLVFELFRVYRELNKNAGSIDDFFFWGEMLVNDFDDVDKYLVDTGKLFINLKEIKDIDIKFGGLTEAQIEIIKQFWVNFDPVYQTGQKSSFQELWSVLLALYHKFREVLISRGIAYEGLIYRELAEKCKRGLLPQLKWDCLHFIGFNALNSCEKELMMLLKKSGKARFYWDYDNSFVVDNTVHSAGFFIRDNLKQFGNNMSGDWSFNSSAPTILNKPSIRVIDSSSDIAQVKLAARIVEESPYINAKEAHHTAIILADENLLLPALSSLPRNVESINITMGYPLKFSPVYSLIRDLLSLQKTLRQDENGEIFFGNESVQNILSNSFFSKYIDEDTLLKKDFNSNKDLWIPSSFFRENPPFDFIFRRVDSAKDISVYLKTILEKLYVLTETSDEDDPVAVGINISNEFIYRVILAINRLDVIVSETDPVILAHTYNKLLDRILRGLSIPFSGEPLNGIQIMGILETRSLDFRNLIILSVNEGVLPQNSATNSFIPYNLREAFGLPTIRHQDSIYAYYFYRLLQRAENVTLIYNSSADGLKTGEMSRFLLQMKYSENPPETASQRFEIKAPAQVPAEIKRSSFHIEKLRKIYFTGEKKILSPSAVNMWINCRMKFYYRYVCGLKEPEKVSKEIDSAYFGKLLHYIMEKIYFPLKNKMLNKNDIELIRNNSALIDQIISEAIDTCFYNGKKSDLEGSDLIICNILKTYVKIILSRDTAFIPLELIELEHNISYQVQIDYENRKENLKIGGVIDRLDKTKGIFRITDYKTGKTTMEIPSIESLFDENSKDHNDAWFQILMYCNIFDLANNPLQVHPSIYSVRNMFTPDFEDTLRIKEFDGQPVRVEDFRTVSERFYSLLIQTIGKIFDPEEPFRMTDNLKTCEYCSYKKLCQR